MRALLVVAGGAVLGYGMWLLADFSELGQVGSVAVWSGVAIVLHDAVLAPAVLALGWLARVLLRTPDGGVRRRLHTAAVVVVVVLGPVTLLAIPVLGRFAADPDKSTLLNRDYSTGWLLLAGAVVVSALLLALTGLVSEASGRGPGRSARVPRPGR
ncbi:MAG: hypothetical protein NTX33_17050 [Propionibacteriales bacterium]|nr:hypothetical protein [Propionibacteriales bacterium]